MNLRDQLIRLGSVNPELRPHIRPLLNKVAGLRHWDQWEQVRDMLGPEDALINVMGYVGDDQVREQFKYMARMWDIPVEVTRRSRPGDLLDEFEPYFRNMEQLADEFVQGLQDRYIKGALDDIARHYDIRVAASRASLDSLVESWANDLAKATIAEVGKSFGKVQKSHSRWEGKKGKMEIYASLDYEETGLQDVEVHVDVNWRSEGMNSIKVQIFGWDSSRQKELLDVVESSDSGVDYLATLVRTAHQNWLKMGGRTSSIARHYADSL